MKTAKPLVSARNPDRQLWRSLLRSLVGTGRATKIWYFGLALIAAGSLTLAGAARADIPPPPDYVETCTLANKQTPTSECLACAADYNNFGRCGPLLSPYCYSKVCQTWGGSAHTEIWCRTKGDGAPVPSEILNILSPTIWPLPSAPDGGPTTAPSSCLPYSPPVATPDASVPAAGGQGGAPATGGTGGQSAVASVPAAGGTGGQSAVASAPATGDTGGQSVVASAPAGGDTGGQGVVTSAPPAGGNLAMGGSAIAATGGAGGLGGSDIKPSDSSGCAVGGWLSAKALGPWLLAGLFGVVVTLARRRRR
ncbi:MAG TPA: hypothetical protein VJ860_19740 [Polyangia bacterium]|nr:hypothetical protein [Polyangia bacterium]